MTSLTEKLQIVIDAAKETELKATIDSWSKWKTSSYIFDISGRVLSVSSMAVMGSALTFSDSVKTTTYIALILQALSNTCDTVSRWCGKKFEQQTKIVNGIIESTKTGKLPEITLQHSDSNNSNNNGKTEEMKVRPNDSL